MIKSDSLLDSEDSSEWNSNDEFNQIMMEVALQHRIDDKLRASPGYAIAINHIPLLFESRKTFNKKLSSYGLKHKIERYLKDQGIKDNYCTNEQFILAMTDLGYDSHEASMNSPNYYFNVNETKLLKEYNKQKLK
jgi:hypothetical protein